mmetsp:Transcript_39857/g.103006  ORF Transcript_39857/g.103006 Transcript_39857/m.103006 type:complete len:90 (+) Transcript_39857:35-304(+)
MSERDSAGMMKLANRGGCLLCGLHYDLRWWEQAIETLFGTGCLQLRSVELIGWWMRMNFAKVEVARTSQCLWPSGECESALALCWFGAQ